MTQTSGVTVPAVRLTALVARLFVAAGIPERSAHAVAEALVDADLEGVSSHGVMLVDMYLDRIRSGSVSAEEKAAVVSDRGAAVVLDARHALGQLTAEQAIGIAVERARRYGAGIVAVRHGFHFGTARRYAIQAAKADCIGIVMCNTRPLMPAPGGAERVVGNNPIAIAVPSDGPIPIVLDMATSEAAMGKIRMAEKDGAGHSAELGRQVRRQRDHESERGHRRHAAAGRRPEGLRPGVPDRSPVRAVVRRRKRRAPFSRSMATPASRTTPRISSSRSTSRISAIPQR